METTAFVATTNGLKCMGETWTESLFSLISYCVTLQCIATGL